MRVYVSVCVLCPAVWKMMSADITDEWKTMLENCNVSLTWFYRLLISFLFVFNRLVQSSLVAKVEIRNKYNVSSAVLELRR